MPKEDLEGREMMGAGRKGEKQMQMDFARRIQTTGLTDYSRKLRSTG